MISIYLLLDCQRRAKAARSGKLTVGGYGISFPLRAADFQFLP